MNVRKILLSAALVAVSCGKPEQTQPDLKGTIATVVGTGVAGLGADGKPGKDTALYLPQDMTFGPDGLMYILDWNNHRVRRVEADGTTKTVAGTGELGDGPPGPALQTRFNHPTQVIFDPQGRMLIAAWHNSRVKRVDFAAGTIEDLFGTGKRAFSGDGGKASTADFDLPVSIAYDSKGNLFVNDQANQRIRRISADGMIATVAGDGMQGYKGDGGPADKAEFNAPAGQAADPAGRIAVDAQDNLYIPDTGNHVIRKIDAKGVITTIAGTGSPGYSGDGGPAKDAQLDTPNDIEIAADGSLYIADRGNSCVRKIDPGGVITTVAGQCGQRGFEGDGGKATSAKLDRPYGIALDKDGVLYIADTHNQRIRKVYP